MDLMLVDGHDGTPNAQICVLSASDDHTCRVFVKSLQAGADAVPSGTAVTPEDAAAKGAGKAAGYSPGAAPPVAATQAPAADSARTLVPTESSAV